MSYLKFSPGGCVVIQLTSGQEPVSEYDQTYKKWRYPYLVQVVQIIQGVEVKGSGDITYFASDTIHRQIQSVNPQINSQFKIWKTTANGRTVFKVYDLSGGKDVEIPDPGPSQQAPPPTPPAGNQPPGGAPPSGEHTYDYSDSQVSGNQSPPSNSPPAGSPSVQPSQPSVSDKRPILLLSRYTSALTAAVLSAQCDAMKIPYYNDRESQSSIAIEAERRKLTHADLKVERDLAIKALKPPDSVKLAFQVVADFMDGKLPDPTTVESLRKSAGAPKKITTADDAWELNLDVGKPNKQRTKNNPAAPTYSDKNPPPEELATAWLNAGYAKGDIDKNGVLVDYGDDLPF